MQKILPENLINLAKKCPYPLYIVGGRVRDFIAGLNPGKYDNDICAPALPDDFVVRAREAGFTVDAVYRNTGTVKLRLGEEDFEFTSFRLDEYVRGVHRPQNTFFTDDISLDARRRDFKCNAVYYDISRGEFVDPLGGIADINAKRVTCVAPAEKVFGEDGLRLMRLARIAAQTGFTPSAECLLGAKNNAGLIKDISPERIYAELNQILHADLKYGTEYAQYTGLKILKDIGVLNVILPELTLGGGMPQPPAYHDYDVLEHTLRCVKYADNSIRLAALLHDIGKPACFIKDGNYHRHDAEGSVIARDICARLRVPAKLCAEVCKLIELHMYDHDGRARESKISKFIVKNYAYLDKLLLLKQADFSACKDDLSVAPSVTKMTAVLEKMKRGGVPLTLKELDVKGDELIAAGVRKELTGKTLNRLLEDCAAGQVKNEKADLLNYAVKVANSLR